LIVTDKFAFVHLPRCGGTFITGLIKKFFPSAHEIGHHLPREALPTEYSHLPLLGTIRNPWDFYVSLYHYIWPRDAASVLASWMSDNGRLGFDGSIRNLLNLGANDALLAVLIEMLPERIDYSKRHVPSVTKDIMRRAQGTGLGYYSFRFNQMFGDPHDMFFCRLETLGQDLVSFFERVDAANDELREYVLNSDRINATRHRHYSTYYTREIAELVSIRDRPLIEKFGYVFEQPTTIVNR
jgi:hypothetical protein